MLLHSLRQQYHRQLCATVLGLRKSDGVEYFTNADKSNKASRALAAGIAEQIGPPFCPNPPDRGQTFGTRFSEATKDFLEKSFALIEHLRPGKWRFTTQQGALRIAAFDQYEHLARLAQLAEENPEIRQILGGDYMIAPDIMVSKEPVTDVEINARSGSSPVVSDAVAKLTPLRATNSSKPTLHASISCKWTMRSDRAQNTRTEALNLMRNRKGRMPHIVVVTAEPLPSRIASIAIGTGDIDCAYHAALPELRAAAEILSSGELGDYLLNEIDDMIASRRLRDIADLPFDLAT